MMKILPNTYEGLIWGMNNFDGIETDLRLTLDDGVVIFHDCYLQTGEKIEELTEMELEDKGIPTLRKFLDLEEVVKLSEDKIMFLELKPNCRGKKRITKEISEKFYERVNQIILESNISKNNIKILSFSKQMLKPFMEEYKCYPILPDVNECDSSFVTLKAVPQFLGKSIKNEIVNGKKIGYAGIMFARQYVMGWSKYRHPSYEKMVNLGKEFKIDLGTNLGTPQLEESFSKFYRFSDILSDYPRNAKEGDGPIIAHRGTGTKGVEIPKEEYDNLITFAK